MLIVEKSYELFDYVGGDLFVDQYWNTFFNFWKITVEYLTKFTNASCGNILLNFNDFTTTRIF